MQFLFPMKVQCVTAILASLVLMGCAASAPPASPFEGAPGVLGSMAQARSTPQQVAKRSQAEVAPAGPAALQSAQAAADSETSRAALKSAEEAYARGDWGNAAQQFKGLTATYPNNGQLWFGYGAASALAGNLNEAAQAFETALLIDNNDARAAYNLSLVRLSQADIALNRASHGMPRAPASVREEIARLRKDLAPLFGRSSSASLDTMVPPPAASAMRIQDPARAQGDGGSATAAPLLQPRPNIATAP